MSSSHQPFLPLLHQTIQFASLAAQVQELDWPHYCAGSGRELLKLGLDFLHFFHEGFHLQFLSLHSITYSDRI